MGTFHRLVIAARAMLRSPGFGELIRGLVASNPGVTLDVILWSISIESHSNDSMAPKVEFTSYPFDVNGATPGHGLLKLRQFLAVLHFAALAQLPAVPLPAGHVLGGAIHEKLRVRVDLQLVYPCKVPNQTKLRRVVQLLRSVQTYRQLWPSQWPVWPLQFPLHCW